MLPSRDEEVVALSEQKLELRCCEALEGMRTMKEADEAVQMVFADPPDNIGLGYDGDADVWPSVIEYGKWLREVVVAATALAPVVWMSINARWLQRFHFYTFKVLEGWDARTIVWYFTFGQHRESDCGSNYRPMVRISRPGWRWHTEGIRILFLQTENQTPVCKVSEDAAKEVGQNFPNNG